MKITIAVLCFALALVSVSGAIGSYDYCGKPCNDGSRITCAYNQRCFNIFSSPCEMKKKNCDEGERFNAVSLSSCLLASNKCRN